jgi:hypothetical protein
MELQGKVSLLSLSYIPALTKSNYEGKEQRPYGDHGIKTL